MDKIIKNKIQLLLGVTFKQSRTNIIDWIFIDPWVGQTPLLGKILVCIVLPHFLQSYSYISSF